MIELTPLDQTTAGQELVQLGLLKGELIGEIRLAQRMLGRPVMQKSDLEKMSPQKLKTIFEALETELPVIAGQSTRNQ